LNPDPPKKRITKQTLQTLAGASEQEVTDLLHWYDTYFDPEMESTEDLEPIEPTCDLIASFSDTPDPGVEVEMHLTEEQLITALGFDDGVPTLFNKIRHIAGLTPWSPDWEKHLAENPNQFEPLRLQWHQLAGVHAALRRILTTDDQPPHVCGILFADDVGIGKTIQSVALVAFIAGLSLRHSRGLSLPPIARESLFYTHYQHR
jgi:hypothetical protein